MAQIKFFKLSQEKFNETLKSTDGLTTGGIYFLYDAGHIYVATTNKEYERYSDQVRYLDAVPADVTSLQKDVVYIVKGATDSIDGGVYVNAGDAGLKKIGVTAAELNAITNNALTADQVVVAKDKKSVKTTGYTLGAGTLTDIKTSGETPVYSDKTLATEKAVAEAINAVSAEAIGVAEGDGISIVKTGTLNTISTDIKIEKLTTANEGATATYQLQIKEAGKDTYKVAGVAIDIPKDMVATKGELVDRKAGETEATGTYIKMTIANGEAFYINVAELIEYNSYEDSDTIEAVEVTAGTHTYKFDVIDGSIGTEKLDDEVNGLLTKAGTALQSGASAEQINYKEQSGETAAVTVKGALDDIYEQLEFFDEAGAAAAVLGDSEDTADDVTVYGVKAYANKLVTDLDADLDATGTAGKNGVFVVSGVTQVDGKITSVDSIEVEKAGAAAEVLGTEGDTADKATVYGAKAYTDAALAWVELP